MQFNDKIIAQPLNGGTRQTLTGPETMVRRHLVRGYSNAVYFVERTDSGDQIRKLELEPLGT